MGGHLSLDQDPQSSVGGQNSTQPDLNKPEISKEHDLWGRGLEAVESAKKWDECIKNPGHKTFIPVREFGIHHLPAAWQNEDYVKLIKIWCDLTVRLRVSYTSLDRPEYDGGTYNPGTGGQRVGTGFVVKVEPITQPRPYINLERQPWQTQRLWSVAVCTAKHVANDDTEVESLCVDFFHDYDESRRDRVMKTLRGAYIVDKNDSIDWCVFTCICSDSGLAKGMVQRLKERKILEKSLAEWLGSLSPSPEVIVSHPHGRSKYVTVGEHKYLDWDSRKYTYTADTCQGSSGSYVLGGKERTRDNRVHHCQGSGESGSNEGFFSVW